MKKHARPHNAHEVSGIRRTGTRLFGVIAGRYMALRRRLADMIGRGDRDYAMLSALSQEIGRIRQRIRADIERRRSERGRRKAATEAGGALVVADFRKGQANAP